MASCEKCWRDSGGDMQAYSRLVLHMKCTPNEQAGGIDAELCDKCRRHTRHIFTKKCMHPDCAELKIEPITTTE